MVDRRLGSVPIRVRRRARTAIGAAGVVNVVSAITPPLAARLRALDPIVPANGREAAAAAAALLGVVLIAVAPGLRRGQRRAWTAAVVLLTATVLASLIKGLDIEEAVASAALAAYLVRHRRVFTARADTSGTRHTMRGAGLVVVAVSLVAAARLALDASKHRPLRPVWLIRSVIGRAATGSPFGTGHGAVWAVASVAVTVAVGALVWGLLRPSRSVPPSRSDLARARDIVARNASSTLDYFALRNDKRHWFHGETLVAFAVLNGVCLVSPDPIGPPHERDDAWRAFRTYAQGQGWTIAVLGAADGWRDVYQDAGMRSAYLGDEAVVDVTSFTLDGGRFKGLRQAVNRIDRGGYTAEVTDPNDIDDTTRAALLTLMVGSRRGDAERGFSMTLGRLFDPADEGLLITIVRDRSGVPVAFCQFVPAPSIAGYSLDVMRRSTDEHPNGLIDFVIVATIRHLATIDARGLSLNFAAMRAVLADENGPTWWRRRQQAVLKRLSHSFQIESLWRFNAKFDPTWAPRYMLVESADQLARVSVASLRAEGVFDDLGVVRRFRRGAARTLRRRSRGGAAAGESSSGSERGTGDKDQSAGCGPRSGGWCGELDVSAGRR